MLRKPLLATLLLPGLAACTAAGPVPGSVEYTAATVSRGYDCGLRVDRGGIVARLILTELQRLDRRSHDIPMPHDERALRVARALLEQSRIDLDLDGWAERAGASRRTLARLFRAQTGLSFAEWRARLRAVDGLARLGSGASVADAAAAVGYASPSAFTAMMRREFGETPRSLHARRRAASGNP